MVDSLEKLHKYIASNFPSLSLTSKDEEIVLTKGKQEIKFGFRTFDSESNCLDDFIGHKCLNFSYSRGAPSYYGEGFLKVADTKDLSEEVSDYIIRKFDLVGHQEQLSLF